MCVTTVLKSYIKFKQKPPQVSSVTHLVAIVPTHPPYLKGRGVGGPPISFVDSSPQKGKWHHKWNSRGHSPPQFHCEGDGIPTQTEPVSFNRLTCLKLPRIRLAGARFHKPITWCQVYVPGGLWHISFGARAYRKP